MSCEMFDFEHGTSPNAVQHDFAVSKKTRKRQCHEWKGHWHVAFVPDERGIILSNLPKAESQVDLWESQEVSVEILVWYFYQ